MILGKVFIEGNECYRVDSDISSQFVATLLDLNVAKTWVNSVVHSIFIPSVLRGLEEALEIATFEAGMPRPRDVHLNRHLGSIVKYFPFILHLRGEDLVWFPQNAQVGVNFLLKYFQILES